MVIAPRGERSQENTPAVLRVGYGKFHGADPLFANIAAASPVATRHVRMAMLEKPDASDGVSAA
jgi:hypothetical protein